MRVLIYIILVLHAAKLILKVANFCLLQVKCLDSLVPPRGFWLDWLVAAS
jgi:hypothetical protein